MADYSTEGNRCNLPDRRLQKAFVCVWLAVLLAVALFIRVHGAAQYHYNPDEAANLSMAEGKTLTQVIQLSRYGIHPPLSNILLHYWIAISNDPAFVRSLSLLFGLMLILVYYNLGKVMNGTRTGMCCAVLAAFSPVCITQSYLVRQGAFFELFLSLGFYYYILWRKNQKYTTLIIYGVWQILACLTHFSGIFSVFCIAACESLRRLHNFFANQMSYAWGLCNLLVATIAFIVYWFWQPAVVSLKYLLHNNQHMTLTLAAVEILEYIINTASISFSFPFLGLSMLLIMLVKDNSNRKHEHFIYNSKELLSLGLLFLIALAVGTILMLSDMYPYYGQRHSMWILPFILPAAGWLLGDTCAWIDGTLRGFNKKHFGAISPATIGILCLGWLSYSPAIRYNNATEYILREKDWNILNEKIDALNDNSAIVIERNNAVLFKNIYPYLGKDGLTGMAMATRIAYADTYLIINPHYDGFFSGTIFLQTLEEALAKHMLDGTDTLVFVINQYSPQTLLRLATCKRLDKILTFIPALSFNRTLDSRKFPFQTMVLVTIQKKRFFEDLVASSGKAHSCLSAMLASAP